MPRAAGVGDEMVDDLAVGSWSSAWLIRGCRALEVATAQTWPCLDDGVHHVSKVGVCVESARV